MPNQQLIDYIVQATKEGQRPDDIKNTLLGAGWQEADINEGFLAVFPVSAGKAVGTKSRVLIVVISVLAILLLAGGGFVYWYFMHQESQVISEEQQVGLSAQEDEQIRSGFSAQEARQPTTPKKENGQQTLDNVFSRVLSYESLQYDMIVVDDGEELVSKNWEKQPFLRGDEENPFFRVIVRPEGYYRLESVDGKFSFFSGDALASRLWFISSLIDQILKSSSSKTVEEEVLNGERTAVISYSLGYNFDPTLETSLISGRIWISEETGLPVKNEATLMGDRDKAVTIFKYSNYSFENIPDSVFEVPKDRIMESLQ